MADVDYFLKVEGIEGESGDDKHKNEIELQSFSFGATNQGSMGRGTGGGTGKVQMHDFTFTAMVNKSSAKLLHACATGKHFPSAVLTCRKAGEKPLEYLVVTLSDVVVSNHVCSGGNGHVMPTDSVSLNFAKIEKQYTPQTNKGAGEGKIKMVYDLVKQTGE